MMKYNALKNMTFFVMNGFTKNRTNSRMASAVAVLALGLASLLSTNVAASAANYAQREDVQAFISEMVSQHGFDREFLTQQFANANRLDNVLASISKPAERVLTCL